jgi:hypothetical protein
MFFYDQVGRIFKRRNPERFATMIARPMTRLSRLGAPGIRTTNACEAKP